MRNAVSQAKVVHPSILLFLSHLLQQEGSRTVWHQLNQFWRYLSLLQCHTVYAPQETVQV